jgi:Protein of unknown function (DUF3089)
MKSKLWALLATVGLSGLVSIATAGSLPAPDYTRPEAWAAWPGTPSHADDTPPGMTASHSTGVPVFFVHPTTYLSPVIANDDFAPGGAVQAGVDDTVLRFQASVFNGCCFIYAPRYRQASLHAITTNTPEAYAADELAYGDVERAFERFLQVNPQGPFILASHSQGSIHALRLLQQQILGKPAQHRLVAAYLVGLALPKEISGMGIPVCQNERATGCVISWNSVRQGREDKRREDTSVIWWQGSYQPIAGRPLVCVNPLSWSPDSSAPATANKGALYSAGRDRPLPPLVPELTGASCEDGLLGIEIPLRERMHFHDALSVFGIYHDFDYGLYYANIRENVTLRVHTWQSAREHD